MRRSDFSYQLPAELIAQHPQVQRSASRLLHVNGSRGEWVDRQFVDLPSLLQPDDLLVFNDTRVIPARVFGVKPTGGRVEIMLERILEGRRILAHVHASKALRAEAPVQLAGGVTQFVGAATICSSWAECRSVIFLNAVFCISLIERRRR
jgi:S-adenosylmethionine:tRNA ribosyltransferase-isomerase